MKAPKGSFFLYDGCHSAGSMKLVENFHRLTLDSVCFAPGLVLLLALPPDEEADVDPALPPDVADETA